MITARYLYFCGRVFIDHILTPTHEKQFALLDKPPDFSELTLRQAGRPLLLSSLFNINFLLDSLRSPWEFRLFAIFISNFLVQIDTTVLKFVIRQKPLVQIQIIVFLDFLPAILAEIVPFWPITSFSAARSG